ncbi:Sulfate adenylyltransferase [Aquirufa nivalisilvae]|uniref:sulfate adenylyltransferase n=1 Tax=Aquirufa nivalisilvae TaxID=2516557 RepID=A0A2S2DXQ6_9BACT|nr:GTP-binding protein [Aquirufa nivalisilvae]AWL10123.1 Sulfate adenylyltransferase [Aquirufa nivalisilvae]MCZ2480750.1 sulfate adenylyltransferase [Aquirufa nivalisilvae]
MDILRIATAGSVDDGKSTLIGRLLYETNSITKDKIEALESASKRKGLDFLDLSLLTDGLIAEREQGITIDVAHIYFSTPTRKYIIADTPGHVEYTRNMVTGASNAKVSLILVDARQGVVEQTARHLSIAALLRIPKVIICVNKMDLVQYDEAKFEAIKDSLSSLVAQTTFEGQEISFLPISSLFGQNITQAADKMPWYQGNTLLGELEAFEFAESLAHAPARFPVQWVIRPKTEEYHDYRGYAGKISSGTFQVGDVIKALPTGQESTIASIEKFGEQLDRAVAGDSVVITLTTDVDISRGNSLVLASDTQAPQLKDFAAHICWLDHQALSPGKTYLLQHGVNLTKAKISQITERLDVVAQTSSQDVDSLKLNEIGGIQLRTAQPIMADVYAENPSNGAFILIDEFSNSTVGVGFVK